MITDSFELINLISDISSTTSLRSETTLSRTNVHEYSTKIDGTLTGFYVQ